MKSSFFALLFLFTQFSFSQDFEKAKLDQLLASIDTNEKGMGSLSIFKDGKEVYQNAFGYADLDQRIKANATTKYRIGSISKTFTAAIIMQLVDENKLSLDDKLLKFFQEIPNASNITIEHLLRHESGIFNITSLPDYPNWMERPISREELINKITTQNSIFEPGSKTEYSNSNYILLTLIIEQLEMRDFPSILNKRIINKLDLRNTNYGGKIQTDQNEAQSYIMSKKWKEATESDMSIPLGAGGVVSTPTDLNVFLNELFTGDLVSNKSLDKMKELKNNFGLGLFQVPFYDQRAFGHNGGIDGFQSNAFYFPDENVSVAYTANAVDMPVNDILIGSLSIYFGKSYDLPEFLPEYRVKADDLDVYLGVYSSSTFPMKITISKEGSTLKAQATGQSQINMEPYEKDKFKFDRAGLKLEFLPKENVMILRQAGAEFRLEKE